MSRTRTPLFLAAVGIVAAVLGALLARNILQSQDTSLALKSGTALQPARPLPTFSLTDQHGQPFDNGRFLNRWSLVFFGFTNCGDVCPTTLTLLASTAKSLADLPDAQRPQVVFVSVDAQRDTPERLNAYLENFDRQFVGVTSTQEKLDAFTRALGMPSAIRPLENGGYAVDHSASILVINPQGAMRALFSPPHTVDALASDYRTLIEAQR